MVPGRGGGGSAGIIPEVPCAVRAWGRRGGPEPKGRRAGPGRDPSLPRNTNSGTALILPSSVPTGGFADYLPVLVLLDDTPRLGAAIGEGGAGDHGPTTLGVLAGPGHRARLRIPG